ncbi:MAG: MFS transporter [Acidimicrobiia bacterium]
MAHSTETSVDASIPDPKRWWTLGVLCLSLVIVMVSNSSMNVALPSIAKDLDATSSQLQWIVDAYSLVFAGMLFAAGTLGDRFGRKGALQGGLTLLIVAAGFGIVSDSATQVIAVRGVMGFAAAFIMPSTLSILANVFPPHERAKAISMWAGISAGGAALGPPITGLLLEHFWWGSVFLMTTPIALLALIAGHRLVPTSRDPDETKLDVPGAVLSALGIGALVYAIIEAPHNGWASARTIVGFVIAVALMLAFVMWEQRSTHPMLDVRLFLDRRFGVSSAGIAVAFFTMFGLMFLITQFFQLVHGLSPFKAGLMILPMMMTLMVVSPRSAALVGRFGPGAVVSIGLGIISCALIALALVVHVDAVWPIFFVLVPMGVGMGLAMSPLTSMIMASVPPSRAGMGSATNDATREVGGAMGVAVLGSLTSTVYIRNLPALSALSDTGQAQARSGLAGALRAAGALTDGKTALIADARSAFVDGMSVAAVSACVLVAIAALASRRFLPSAAVAHRPPDQMAAKR